MLAALPLGEYGLADAMVLAVTVANQNVRWRIFQTPKGDSLIIYLSKSMANSLFRLILFYR